MSTRARSDRERGQRLDRRQSLPLHRLPPDRRCRRLPPAPGRARTGSPPQAANDTTGAHGFLADAEDIFIGTDDHFFAAPASLDSLADLYERIPTRPSSPAPPMSGCGSPSSSAICRRSSHIGRARGLDRIEDTGDELIVGAMATYAAGEPLFRARIDPDLGELLRRLGSKQVRASGTVVRQCRQRLADRRHAAGADRARRDLELRKGKRVRTMPRRGVLPRLRQAGPRAGRIRHRLVDPEARGRPHLPLLQGLQALRPGHLRR